MKEFWHIVSGAPWWVYALFVYFVLIGVKSMKPRTIPIKLIVLLPLVFVGWSFYSLYGKLQLGLWSLLPVWIVFLALGAYLGKREVQSWKIISDRQKGMVTIPGNYSTLVLILLIFVLKFTWGYFYATRAEIPYGIYFADTLTTALVSGFFVGRAAVYYYRYHHAR